MRTAQLWNFSAGPLDRVHHPHDLLDRRRHSREQKRGRAAASVVVADRAKCFGGSLHRVAAHPAVDMKIDESGCDEIALKVDYLLAASLNLAADLRDLSLAYVESKTLRNSVGKDRPSIRKNHGRQHHCVYWGSSPSSSCKWSL